MEQSMNNRFITGYDGIMSLRNNNSNKNDCNINEPSNLSITSAKDRSRHDSGTSTINSQPSPQQPQLYLRSTEINNKSTNIHLNHYLNRNATGLISAHCPATNNLTINNDEEEEDEDNENDDEDEEVENILGDNDNSRHNKNDRLGDENDVISDDDNESLNLTNGQNKVISSPSSPWPVISSDPRNLPVVKHKIHRLNPIFSPNSFQNHHNQHQQQSQPKELQEQNNQQVQPKDYSTESTYSNQLHQTQQQHHNQQEIAITASESGNAIENNFFQHPDVTNYPATLQFDCSTSNQQQPVTSGVDSLIMAAMMEERAAAYAAATSATANQAYYYPTGRGLAPYYPLTSTASSVPINISNNNFAKASSSSASSGNCSASASSALTTTTSIGGGLEPGATSLLTSNESIVTAAFELPLFNTYIPNPTCKSELELLMLLQSANLASYFATFLNFGGDDVQQLCDADEDEFLEIMSLVGMTRKPLHVRRLQKALINWRQVNNKKPKQVVPMDQN